MTRLCCCGPPVASALTVISVPTPDGSPIATASSGATLESCNEIFFGSEAPVERVVDHAIDGAHIAIARRIERAQRAAAFERVERFEQDLTQRDDRAIGRAEMFFRTIDDRTRAFL